MALYRITARNSVDTTGTGLDAFDQDGVSGPNFLFVTAGAFLRSDTNLGARLDDPQPWNLFVSGSIISEQSYGVLLASGGLSNVQVLRGGRIEGGADGIGLDGNVNIRNYGTIVGSGTGTFEGNGIGMFGAGVRTITNFGTITGTSYSIFDAGEFGVSRITNFGTLNGDVNLGYGDDVLVNWGRINGTVYGGAQPSSGSANLKITNHGTIDGDLSAGDGADMLINRGVITGYAILGSDFPDLGTTFINSGRVLQDVLGSGGDDTIVNSGFIQGNVDFDRGTHLLRNTGTIGGDLVSAITLQTSETIINHGTIRGSVNLGGGNDSYSGSGVVLGSIDLGSGDDAFTGTGRADEVLDGGGSDTYVFAGGNDQFLALNNVGVDGSDDVDGGAGIDTYNAHGALGSLTINIDSRQHGNAIANTATGCEIGGLDRIKNFENVVGSIREDVIYGSAAANVLDGHVSGDEIYGFAGNDVLIGGEGDDRLVGGLGRDRLLGNMGDGAGDGGRDTYVFQSVADSGKTAATRDIIVEFEDSFDVIDLAGVDANSANGAGDDTFSFIGNVAFHRLAGELRVSSITAGWVVEGDTNGDGKADFSIQVDDSSHAIVIDSFDFVL